MTGSKKVNFFSGLMFLLSIVLFLFFISSENIFAQKKPQKKTDNWTVNLSFSPFYDSNILKYSEKYIERFKNLQDEGRFHINRIDDLALNYSIDIVYTTEFFGKQKSFLGAGYNSNIYTYNSINTWSSYNIFWRQGISGTTSFNLSYSYIPRFYVRHFRDDDWVRYYGFTPVTFQPYEFSKDDFSLWVQQIAPWKTTRARFYFSYMRYYLNKAYTEYDSDDFLFGVRFFHSFGKSLEINAGYAYSISYAKGYDEPGETRENSDDSDATNYDHNYRAGFDLKLPKVFSFNNNISFTAQYQRTFFTTDNFVELDLLHAGRYDYNYRLFVNYNLQVTSNLSLTVYYNWMKRESGSPSDINNAYISDEKDYTQYRMGMSFNYQFTF
jgi:hypothetical protein